MPTISMLEFLHDAEAILGQVQKGQAFVLTNRGHPVARLEPVDSAPIPADDLFF